MDEIKLSIEDVDLVKRTPLEWAKIYNFKIFGNIKNDLWSEYEWAYNLSNIDYMTLPDRNSQGKLLETSEKSENMEIRAMMLKADLFKYADMGEKHVLKSRYVETDAVRYKLNLKV